MKNSLLVFLLLFAVVRGYSQCTLSVNLSSSNPSICSGTSVVLTAAASAGTAPYTYSWSTGETTSSISVNKPGTYTVTVTDKTLGCQPLKQGITITAGITPVPPTAANAVACPNSPVTLTATAPGGTYQWYDAAVGGNFLATGASYTTPPITANTVFYVQTTLNGCTSQRSAVSVTVVGKPPTQGATVCYGDPATLLAAGGGTYAWYDAASGGNLLNTTSSFTTPPLTATTTYYVVVTSPTGCVSAPVPVVANVTPPPASPTAAGVTICSGAVATLHASGSGTLDWFTAPTGGTSLISSPDFTTPSLSATTTYYVQSTVNTCVSARTPVTVTVNTVPAAPVVPPATTCAGSTATLTPTGPGGTYQWYNAPAGGILLFTGPSFTTPVLSSSTTYYVQVTNGCTSARTAVTVTVTQAPSAPSAPGAVICSGTSATLTATAPGGIYQWYDAASAGNLLATGASFTTPVLSANTTYYVETTVNGCTSSRTPVTVTILAPPAAPTAPGTSICSGNTATLSVTSPSGNYAWYDAATNGNLLGVGSVFVTPALATTTIYYVESTNSSGCASARTPVTVTVNSPPSAPVASGATICPGSNATLTATGAGGTFSWYDAATGGNLLFTGATFVTPALSTTTTYYVDQTTTCTSTRTAVTVNITAVASPQFNYSSGTYCTSASNQTPVIHNPAGGTFSAAPAGLVFVSTTTGQINIAASAPGTYTISFAGNGPCPATTNTTITITATPNAQFSYTGPYCQDAVTALATFPAGSSGGTFSASPAGLFFLNTTTGEINPSKSLPGTYTVTNTIPASGTCSAITFTSTVTINQSVFVVAGPNQTVASGAPVTLAGSVTGGATTGTWSGGTGSFSNPSQLNATYTPGPGETSATLTLTSSDPAGPCGPKSSTVTITFAPIPPAPTVAGAAICSGDVATLSATAPGGSYDWYNAPTGGTLLFTGASFTTPALTTNTTYYVQTTVGASTSSRTAVTVTINAIPAAPLATGVTICSGNLATLNATGSAGGYEWYDAPTGGNLLSTNSTYTTTFLSANTSYYVQSVVNGCPSARVKVDVTISPVPAITSASTGNICSGNALNYTITASVPGSTFNWSRAAVANISNTAVTNQTSSPITETLINTGTTPVNVTYVITPTANGCSGTPFNYVVTVNPSPTVTSAAAVTVCNSTPLGYNITFNTGGIQFTWSRAAVAGISNAAISGQASTTILESLFNTTTAPINVTYVISYQTASCTGLTFNLIVTVNPPSNITSAAAGNACTGVALNYTITSDVPTATFVWSRVSTPGISNPTVLNQTTSTITETLINTTTSPVPVGYNIKPYVNGCAGAPFLYTVTVYPAVPTPVANANSPVCTGNPINLQSPIIPGATYNWSGPNGFSSNQQNPTINGATVANAGTYNLFITLNGCSSTTVSVNVVVDPPPVANAGPDQTVCTNVASVQLAGSVTGGTTTGIWSTSGTGSFQPRPDSLNAQYVPSAQDIASGSVTLTLSSTSKDNCNVSTSTMKITFNAPIINSSLSGSVCSGTALNYQITSDDPNATFSWSRSAVPNISNPAVNGQTSSTITETLINTGTSSVAVKYIITPIANGCPGTPFTYTVAVNPIPGPPAATANTPVCVNTTLQLQAPTIANATYSWTGPNGFTSALQNPTVANVTTTAAGTYFVNVTVNGCTGPNGGVNVVVDQLPVANAGPDQLACPTIAGVTLAGTVTGGTTTGIWSTSGTGSFLPSDTTLNGQYTPSQQDIANGSVVLTLSSTSNDNCNISTSRMTIKFQLLKAVTAGPDQSICSQSIARVSGQITIPGGGVWATSGTGTFNPAATVMTADYIPSPADIQNGSVVLTLTANNPGQCYIPSDHLTLKFIPPPTVNAGGTIYVLKGHTVTLTPTVSDPNVTYLWTPNVDISSTTVENPVVTGNTDQTYTLTVTDSRGCVAQDQVNVIVSPPIVVPNTFTPNGDGVNDLWNIQGLTAYQQASVDIFDRNGQKVYHSIGYTIPWDGTYNGKQVPYGVYYYIIDPRFSGLKAMSGYVTVVR